MCGGGGDEVPLPPPAYGPVVLFDLFSPFTHAYLVLMAGIIVIE